MSGQLEALCKLVQQHQPVTVLTGAGISVASGLPVYRNAKADWVHSKPVEGPAFRKDEKIRQRYWSRSFIGWQAFSRAAPNQVHNDLATLEHAGIVSTIITQNVDGLHQKAGSKHTVALHGNLSEVICLSCEQVSQRSTLQQRLTHHNPEFHQQDFQLAPDGDAQISAEHIERFSILACEQCGGTLKPHVVFFGDNVPKTRVEYCKDQLKSSGLLLCVGTSLMVYSGLRFCKTAQEGGIPIAIVNDGITRADDMAQIKVGGDCTEVIAHLRQQCL